MLKFTVFELYTLLANLGMTDTIFGEVPVRTNLMRKLRDFLDDNDFLIADAVVESDVVFDVEVE